MLVEMWADVYSVMYEYATQLARANGVTSSLSDNQ